MLRCLTIWVQILLRPSSLFFSFFSFRKDKIKYQSSIKVDGIGWHFSLNFSDPGSKVQTSIFRCRDIIIYLYLFIETFIVKIAAWQRWLSLKTTENIFYIEFSVQLCGLAKAPSFCYIDWDHWYVTFVNKGIW